MMSASLSLKRMEEKDSQIRPTNQVIMSTSHKTRKMKQTNHNLKDWPTKRRRRPSHSHSTRQLITPISRSNTTKATTTTTTSRLQRIKLFQYCLLTLFTILAGYYSSINLCQSALLTNIYGGKKLSELTDFANRYLIVPSPMAGQSNINNIQLSNNNEEELATDIGATAQQQPQASPLVASWKSNQQQQQQQQQLQQRQQQQSAKSAKLFVQQQQPGGAANGTQQTKGNNNNILLGSSSSSSSNLDTSLVPGEPSVLESVSTEFPNPNINNLGHEITKILKKFFLHGYDKRVRPNYSGPPALVNVSFHIIGISSVDEVQMDFTTDFYFRQKWYDPRLEFDPVGQVNELCVGAEFADRIWLPDTFFANEKTATFHKATTENTFIRIAHTGRVYRSIRLTVTCSCPMDLQYFPMDRQRCKIEIESYGYNTRDIDYRWEIGDASVTLETKIELPQFKILGWKMGQELQNLSSGDYIRLYCEIHFVRSMGYYLIQIYIPASLIVMISWVSFWLHRNATPARVALGVTTVLTMTTLMSSTNAALPKISYIKSIDVFLGTCFVMVFASLLEYASVGYIGKRIAMKRKRLQDLQQMQQHHQKVCVAAAASAAAAAAAAQESNPIGVAPKFAVPTQTSIGGNFGGIFNHQQQQQQPNKDSLIVTQLQVPLETNTNDSNTLISGTQTLQRRPTNSTTTSSQQEGGSKTLQRVKTNGGGLINIEPTNAGTTSYGQRSAIKVMLDNNQQQSSHYHESPNATTNQKRGAARRRLNPVSPLDQTRTPLLTAGAAIAAAAANQTSHGPTTEFEVSQTHDMIKICGLTPSAIDKHSRVVFPICFVCFNLMYWIIYGHISQQIEDKGPPLIPFIKG